MVAAYRRATDRMRGSTSTESLSNGYPFYRESAQTITGYLREQTTYTPILGMLTCPFCKSQFKALTTHLRSAHGVSTKEFSNKFPGYPLVSDETKRKTSATSKKSGCGKWRKGQPMSEETRRKRKQLSSVQVGASFGESVVVELLEEVLVSKRLRQKVRCKCSCGGFYDTFDIYLWRIENPRCQNCVRLSLRKYSPGDKYDMLTILRYDKNEPRKKVTCRCDCGKVIRIRPSLLKLNKTNNCGCAPRGGWEGVGDLSKSYYTRTQRGAKLRAMEFTVSMEYLWDLYKSQGGKCALSGVSIGLNTLPHGGGEASLDRINSSIGYVEGNVQWVHKDLNLMKMDFDQDRFIELCRSVASYLTQEKQPHDCSTNS
jgi:hypothetical protein